MSHSVSPRAASNSLAVFDTHLPSSSPVSRFYTFFCRICSVFSCRLPVLRNVFDIRHTLILFHRLQIISLCLGIPLIIIHMVILAYTLTKESRCHEPFILWLSVLLSISTGKAIPQIYLMYRADALLQDWHFRSVTVETCYLLKSRVVQLERMLGLLSFIWYFIGFHWAYETDSCNNIAPVLYQYITVLVLAFLALIGLNCILIVGSSVVLFYRCCLPMERFVELFEDRTRGFQPLPKRLIQNMKCFRWNSNMFNINNAEHTCSICLCDYEAGQKLRELPCMHTFHIQCIDKWFKTHSTCPLRCHVNFFTGKKLDIVCISSTEIGGMSVRSTWDTFEELNEHDRRQNTVVSNSISEDVTSFPFPMIYNDVEADINLFADHSQNRNQLKIDNNNNNEEELHTNVNLLFNNKDCNDCSNISVINNNDKFNTNSITKVEQTDNNDLNEETDKIIDASPTPYSSDINNNFNYVTNVYGNKLTVEIPCLQSFERRKLREETDKCEGI